MMDKLGMIRVTGAVGVGALLAGMLFVTPASAQSAVPTAGCFVEPAKMPNSDIQAFLGSPETLLTQFPSGGLTLSSQVRSLAGSSADALQPLMALASRATPAQAAAIGGGLARVARACVATDPEYVATIQAEVASAELSGLETAFTAGLNETQTAAVGAGGSAAAGPAASAIGGGGTPGGGVNGNGDGSESTATSVQTFSTRSGSSYFSNGSVITREISCSNPNCS